MWGDVCRNPVRMSAHALRFAGALQPCDDVMRIRDCLLVLVLEKDLYSRTRV